MENYNTDVAKRQTKRTNVTPLVKPFEQAFINALADIEKTGLAPADDVYEKVGTFRANLEALVSQLGEYGIDGYRKAKNALMAGNDRLMHLASLPATTPGGDPDQEELDERMVIGKKGRPVFRLITEDDLDKVEAPRCLISGVLREVSVSMMYGMANCGKTFNALHLAQCVSRGMSWLGRHTNQGTVLYICAEGGDQDLMLRSRAWRQYYEQGPAKNLFFATSPVYVNKEYDKLLETVEDYEIDPALVVIDTFSNCTIGVNQNLQEEVAPVLAVAHKIATKFKCHVMFIHHANWSEKVNGSAAFLNHVDTMIKLTREAPTAPVNWLSDKQRGMAPFKSFAVEMVPGIETGRLDPDTFEPLTSCIVRLSDQEVSQGNGLNDNQQTMFNIITPEATRYTDVLNQAKELGMSETTAKNVLKDLVKRGLVIRDDSKGRKAVTYYLPSLDQDSTSSDVEAE